MAKQCIYCGHLLAKDDARFCNDCGRTQVSPANAGVSAGAPSAIKVRLPPREFVRDDSSEASSETSLPEPAASATPIPPSPREQVVSPSSRMPKRPTRPNPPASSPASVDGAKPTGDALAAMTRQAGSGQSAVPTSAEEISTMVLPNWREELALLRKEQEQAGSASSSGTSDKKAERATPEPPPLPRRSPNTPLSPREVAGSPTPQPRPQVNPSSPVPPDGRVSQERARAVEGTRERIPNTPLPRESTRGTVLPQGPRTPLPPLENARVTELPQSQGPRTPLPPLENDRVSEAARRELRIKVWEQEDTVQHPQVQEKPKPGPVPAVTQDAFAGGSLHGEAQDREIEDLETANWQAPLSPIPASPSQPPVREANQAATREAQRQPVREEKRQPVGRKNDDIEDLPTVPLAVPDVAGKSSQIKVERASTPAPKRRSTPLAEDVEVEDLPTRPLVASPPASVSPVARMSQQTPTGEWRPGPGQIEAPSPFASKAPDALSAPGAYSASAPAQPLNQAAETLADPLASRSRPVNPRPQSGPGFNPASLPPLSAGPLAAPGSSGSQGPQQQHPSMSTEPFGQRPPTFEAAPASPPAFSSATSNASTATAGVDDVVKEKPRKKRRPGRMVAIILVLLVLLGGGTGAALNWSWLTQYISPSSVVSQPYQAYQNSAFGVSLEYTQGWHVNVDQAHSVVHFADSSHTNQANLSMAAASGQASDYLNQQAIQQGVIGPKAAPAVTIAGTSWQALQGTVTQSGATYIIVLYATEHNNRFYLLTFLAPAPQPTFAHADQSDFAHMRTSFKFV